MALSIFPASPEPDNVFPVKQGKPRVATETEYGYVVKRHRSNFAPRTFQLSYGKIKLSDRDLLKDYIVAQDYGIEAFLYKHPTEDLSIYASSNQNALLELTDETTGNLAQGFKLKIQSKIHRVQLYLKKTGSPAGNLTLKLATDDSGKPSSSILATSETVAVSTVTGSYTLIEFAFETPARLEPFTQYHFILEGDATYDTSFVTATTVVELGVDSTSPTYTFGAISTYAAAVWVADATRAAIFTIPDYTRVQTEESLWSEERFSGAELGMFNVNVVLVEDA